MEEPHSIMLRPKKKISKKELKKDTLVTTYMQVTAFYDKYQKYVGAALFVVAAVAAGTYFYVHNRSQQGEQAATRLGEVYQLFGGGQYQTAIDGVPEKNIAGLKSIVDDYGSTTAGNLARLYLGDCYLHLGKYDEALQAYESFSPTEDFLAVSKLAGIAVCFEAKGMHKDAAEYFEKAATSHKSDPQAAENMNNAARNYAQAGEKVKALDLYKKLKKDFPATSFGREADRFIAELSV